MLKLSFYPALLISSVAQETLAGTALASSMLVTVSLVG